MTKSEYKQQLSNPMWKARRLEILNRDNHKCRFCGSKTNVQVHHLEYENLLLAWEYPDEKLITLCELCHKKQHSKPLNIKKEKAIQVYYENLMPFYAILHNSTVNVLWAIMAKLEYDTAMVYLTADRRIEICSELNISGQYISNALNQLKRMSIVSGSNGNFMINPAMFWYGKKETRLSMLLTPSIQDRFNFKIED